MNYAQEEEKGKLDELVEDKDVRVIVDSQALIFLVGTEMDYVDDEIKSEFVFNNPNTKGSCGCGESFNFWPLSLFTKKNSIIVDKTFSENKQILNPTMYKL